MFAFDHEADRALAFNQRPWTIHGAHLVLKIWSPDLALSEIDFSSSAFWIQVHGLPPAWYNKDNVQLVRGKAGSVIDVDFSEVPYERWQRFAHVPVNIDICNPLSPGIFLSRGDRNDIWISLKYERLPDFCFWCGIIDHTDTFCEASRVVLSNDSV